MRLFRKRDHDLRARCLSTAMWGRYYRPDVGAYLSGDISQEEFDRQIEAYEEGWRRIETAFPRPEDKR